MAPRSAGPLALALLLLLLTLPETSAASGSLLAPASACPSQETLTAPASAQVEAMRCMTAFARRRAGFATLADSPALDWSARHKAGDVLRCDSFSHTACGREFTYWMQRSGYLSTPCWRAGEVLGWGIGRYGTVRAIFRAWMASPGHRRIILGGFEGFGFGLRRGELEGRPAARVWVGQFGTHCETTPSARR